MNVFSRGVRNAFRNSIRTVAIVGMLGLSIGLSLALLLAHQAIGQKIQTVQENIGNTITIAPAGIRGFIGGGAPLTSDQLAGIKSVAHITGVDETLTDRLTADNTSLVSGIEAGDFGRRQFRIGEGQSAGGDTGNIAVPAPDFSNFKPPITVVGATNLLASVPGENGSAANLSSGNSFDGTKDSGVALVGKTLAAKNNLSVGSTFTAYGSSITVSGIYDAGNTFGNNQAILPLPTVQRLSSQTGEVTGAIVHIDSAVNLDSVTAALKSKLGSAADVSSDADNTKTTLNSLENIHNVSLFSLVGAAATSAVIILLTMIMIVRERRREIGVLKAIGGSNLRVMLQFAVESVTLTVLAAVVGIIIGSVAATPVTKLLANNTTTNEVAISQTGQGGTFSGSVRSSDAGITVRGFGGRLRENSVTQGVKNLRANVNPGIALYGFGSAVLVGLVGSMAAAGLIAKIRPAEVMRTE